MLSRKFYSLRNEKEENNKRRPGRCYAATEACSDADLDVRGAVVDFGPFFISPG